MDTLSSLVDSSLIRPEPRDDEPQFSMLETIREYALSRLRETGDWAGTHDKHAAYFLALARPAESELHGSGQLAWLNRLEPQHDNLNAALSWLLDRGRPAEAVDLLWTTWRFWWLHSYVPRAPHDDAARASLRARMVGAAFDRAWKRGRTLDTASVVRYAREEASDARREAG
jgi:predicted ATPase